MRRYVRGSSAQKLDWLVVEEITQLDMALWADLACVGLTVAGRALLGSSARLWSTANSSAGRRAGTSSRGRTPRWSSATASAWPSTPWRRRPQSCSIHIDLGETQNGCSQAQNSPQSMRVLRLMGAGGKIPKGVFVAVAEVEPDGVRLDNGMRLKNQELLRATRPSHAVTRQLPGPHPPQPRPPGPGVLPPHAAPPVRGRLKGDKLRAAGGGLAERQHGASRGSSIKSTPHCLPISHTCRASTSARPLRRANRRAQHAVAGRVPEEAALQVHLALHVLALGAAGSQARCGRPPERASGR